MQVNIGLSFLAGIASFLSPCVLALVPAYIGYLGGQSIMQNTKKNTLRTFLHGIMFVAGFSLIFILFGVTFALLGGLLQEVRIWFTKIGGLLVILFGLHMTGLLRLKFLEFDIRIQANTGRELGFLSSFLMGISFSAGWSPCIGPVLGSILTLAMQRGSIGDSIALLSAYSLGMAIPFLLAGLSVGWVTKLLRKHGKLIHFLEVTMGVLLVIMGFLLFLGLYERFAALGNFFDFGL